MEHRQKVEAGRARNDESPVMECPWGTLSQDDLKFLLSYSPKMKQQYLEWRQSNEWK